VKEYNVQVNYEHIEAKFESVKDDDSLEVGLTSKALTSIATGCPSVLVIET